MLIKVEWLLSHAQLADEVRLVILLLFNLLSHFFLGLPLSFVLLVGLGPTVSSHPVFLELVIFLSIFASSFLLPTLISIILRTQHWLRWVFFVSQELTILLLDTLACVSAGLRTELTPAANELFKHGAEVEYSASAFKS